MTCPACDHPRVTLHDGRETCSWSRAWLEECEASTILAMPLIQRRRYLWGYHNTTTGKWVRGVKEFRGEAALAELQNRITALWNARQLGKGERPADGGA